MASSMSTGERRWTSARRGGMTLLGKVAVPKPINLPSQRLENHGLEPRVEIVPKGTLSWGSRSSSSASNPWGSSTFSPNADGDNSQNHNRPSSGGSGTRPSTAGSDRAPEANAWGPSSRPSSASGSLTSNQTSASSLRPCSADTRPGSSQLSRFAESCSENSVAWAGAATAEKLGVKSSKNDGFSLIPGDFPSLGSEKDSDHCSYGRLGSSSGVAANGEGVGTTEIGEVALDEDAMSGTVNSWKKDNFRYSEEGIRPNMENYQGHPQHYEPWRGPPVNPGGVWYGVPPGGPPYGAPLPLTPGSNPMEPFRYYHPHIPSAALGNPQSVPSPGGVPRGHPSNSTHPKNSDMYRPQMPEAYIRPSMPTRPGFYPGPIAYDGYYGPPMGYCNLNERDIPFMGMPVGSSTYNRYPSQNAPDPSNSSASSTQLASESGESVHVHDSRGPYRVLLKQHSGKDGKIEQKWGDTATTDEKYLEKDNHPRTSWEDDWETDQKQCKETDPSKVVVGEEASNQTSESGRRHFSGPVKTYGNVGNKIEFGDISEKNLEHAPSCFSGVSQPITSSSKDSTKIHKREVLKEKARASDRRDGVRIQQNMVHLNLIDNHTTKETGSGMHVSAGDNSLLGSTSTTGASISRRPHGMQVRTVHHGRGRFEAQEFDGWLKRSLVGDSSSKEQAVQFEASSSIHVKGLHTSAETTKMSWSYSERKDGEESRPTVSDPNDFLTQHSNMRELAKQRVKQLQEEEEERISEQKASARAKLEELDRRTRAAESAIQKSKNVSPVCMRSKQQESTAEPIMISGGPGVPKSSLGSNREVVSQVLDTKTSKIEITLVPSSEPPLLKVPKSAYKEHAAAHNHSVILLPTAARNLSVASQLDVNNGEASQQNNAGHLQDGASKQKNVSYKEKSGIPSKKSYNEKFASNSSTMVPKRTDVPVKAAEHTEVGNEFASCHESSLPVNSKLMVEPLVHQRRKNSRNAKTKHKVDPSDTVDLAPLASKEQTVAKSSAENATQNVSESKPDSNSVQSLTDKDTSNSSDHCSSLSNDEAHNRVNSVSKSQLSHGRPRNKQNNRLTDRVSGGDTVVWAPVRSQNKNEATDESSRTLKADPVQNIAKSKGAEIERYVPKPVAQEMAHHGSPQESVKQSRTDETICFEGTKSVKPADSATGKNELPMDSRNRYSRPDKQAKAHGSWRQRGLTDSVLQDGPSYSSNLNKNVQTSTRHQGTWNTDLDMVIDQQKFNDQTEFLDGWNMPDCTKPASPIRVPIVKDQGVTGRGKRHPFKGHRGTVHDDLDQKKSKSGDRNRSYGLQIQADLPGAAKDNHAVSVMERSTSQWQPKSQTLSTSNQQESKSCSDLNIVAEVGKANIAELDPQAGMSLPQQEKEKSGGIIQHHHDESIVVQINVEEAPNVGHQVAKIERKTHSFRGRDRAPYQDHASTVESAASTDIRHEHRRSSGFHKNINHNNHFGRGHEYRDDWSSIQQDSDQHNLAANQEWHRQNVHSGLKPTGPYNNNRSKNIEGPKDGYYNTGPKFNERGQGHTRRGRGNFNPRQSGSVQVASSYN